MISVDNSQLIYDYTEKLYNARSLNIDSLNTRVGAVLAASVGLIKIIADLPQYDTVLNYQFYARCAGFGLIILCILLCFINLLTRFYGGVADPYILASDDYIDREPFELRYFIISYWAKSIEEYTSVIDRKAKLLNASVVLLLLSISLFFIASIPSILG